MLPLKIAPVVEAPATLLGVSQSDQFAGPLDRWTQRQVHFQKLARSANIGGSLQSLQQAVHLISSTLSVTSDWDVDTTNHGNAKINNELSHACGMVVLDLPLRC